jgi:hypothetical protein
MLPHNMSHCICYHTTCFLRWHFFRYNLGAGFICAVLPHAIRIDVFIYAFILHKKYDACFMYWLVLSHVSYNGVYEPCADVVNYRLHAYLPSAIPLPVRHAILHWSLVYIIKTRECVFCVCRLVPPVYNIRADTLFRNNWIGLSSVYSALNWLGAILFPQSCLPRKLYARDTSTYSLVSIWSQWS